MTRLALIFGVALAYCAANARGDILIVDANNPQVDENVLFNEVDLITTGTTVQGVTNSSGVVVNFVGMEQLTTAALGQARIEALTGTFDSLTVELEAPDATYTSLIFNLNAEADGQATIRVFEDDATLTEASFDIGQNGENFFTVTAVNNQRIASVEITTTAQLSDVAQVRVGGVIVPEPAAMKLALAACVAGFVLFANHREG
jgi:hypothetical protein